MKTSALTIKINQLTPNPFKRIRTINEQRFRSIPWETRLFVAIISLVYSDWSAQNMNPENGKQRSSLIPFVHKGGIKMRNTPSGCRFVSWLFVLPFFGMLIPQPLTERSVPTVSADLAKSGLHRRTLEPNTPQEEVASDASALTTLRILATLLEWHKYESGEYASKRELLEWAIQSGRFKTPPIGKGLFSQLNVFSDNILPGWRLRLHISTSRREHLTTIRSVTGAIFALDENLLIYKGNIPENVSLPDAYAPLNEVVSHGLVPLGTGQRCVRRRCSDA